MPRHLTWVVGELADGERAALEAMSRLLRGAGWQNTLDEVPDAPPAAVLLWTHSGLSAGAAEQVTTARQHRVPLFLLGPTLGADLPELTEASGVAADRWSPSHRARVRPAGPSRWSPPTRAA